MADIRDSEITWISLKEMQCIKLCRHCHEPMMVKQMNLTEACRKCFNDKCCIPFTDIPEVEYIQRSYRYMDCSLDSVSGVPTKLCFEEEMQSINKLFCEVESMLSSKGVKQLISELPLLSTKSLLSIEPVTTPSSQESPHQQDCGDVNINPVSNVHRSINTHIHQSDQHTNVTDITNYITSNLNINDLHVIEQCTGPCESTHSKNAFMVRDESKPSADINYKLLSSDANGITAYPDVLPYNACSEDTLSNSMLENQNQLSNRDFEEILAIHDTSLENIDKIMEFNNCGLLTNWLENSSEEIPLQNLNTSAESVKDIKEVICPVEEVHVTTVLEGKKEGYCTSEESHIKIEEETSKNIKEDSSFPSSEGKRTIRCYRPSKKRQQVTTGKLEVNAAPDVVQPVSSFAGGTLRNAAEKDGLFATWHGKTELLNLSHPDAEEAYNECKEEDPYELFTDTPADTVFLKHPLLQEEESTDEVEFIQSIERPNKKLSRLRNYLMVKKPEKVDDQVETCNITKKENQDENLSSLKEHTLVKNCVKADVKVENCEVTENQCEILNDSDEEVKIIGCSYSEVSTVNCIKNASRKSSKGKNGVKSVGNQRRKVQGRKTKLSKTKTSVESKPLPSTVEQPKICNKAFLGFSELSNFQGAKCSLPSQAGYACKRQSRKKGKQIEVDRETPTDVSAEIDQAVAGVQMSALPEPSGWDDLLKTLM